MDKLHGEDTFQIRSYKHDQTLHRIWKENIALHRTEYELIGMNNYTTVIEPNGDKWITEEPALFYFHREYWFNIVYIFNHEKRYFYCNISSPYMFHQNVLSYVDYDLDIIVYDDFSYKLLDEDEYNVNKQTMKYGEKTEQKIMEGVVLLKEWIKCKKGPFQPRFVDDWFNYGEKYFI